MVLAAVQSALSVFRVKSVGACVIVTVYMHQLASVYECWCTCILFLDINMYVCVYMDEYMQVHMCVSLHIGLYQLWFSQLNEICVSHMATFSVCALHRHTYKGPQIF